MSLASLVRYKLLMALRGFTRGERQRRVRRIVGTVAVLAALTAFTTLTQELFASLAAIGPAGVQAASAMVTMTLHVILVLALVFDIATAANIFFLSGDLGLLMAAPIPTHRVFALKYLEASVAVSFVSLFVGLPVLIGYGAGLGAPLVFYPAALAVVAVFLSIPVSAGTICGLLASRFVRAGRVREMVGVLGGVIGLAVWLGFQLLKPGTTSVAGLQDMSARVNTLAARGSGLLDLLPSRFPAEVITAVAARDWRQALAPAAALVALAAGAYAVSLLLAERIYLTGWTRAAAAGSKKAGGRSRRARTRPRGASALLLGWLPPVVRSILGATGRLMLRDPQQITPIAMISIMMALFPFFVGRSGRTGLGPGPVLFSISMLTFTGSMNLATGAVMMHGRSFWHVLLAPASAWKRLGAHSAAAALFFTGLAAALASGLGLAGIFKWVQVAKAVWLSASLAALGSSVGVLMAVSFGDWRWETPKRMLRLGGRLAGLGLVMAVFAALGAGLGFFSGPAGPLSAGAAQALDLPWRALAAASAVAALAAALMLAASAARLDRMEWLC